MSIFGDSLRTIVDEIHRTEGAPVIAYAPVAGDPLVLVAVFDAVGTVVDLATGVAQRTNVPSLGVVLADFATPPRPGDSVDIDAVNYKVSDVELDGQGGATLLLRRA